VRLLAERAGGYGQVDHRADGGAQVRRLAASFFFLRGGGDVGHVGKFVTSIAVQLAQNVPAARQHISDAVAERSDVASQSLHSQWQHLILRPLLKLHKSEQELETYIS
jgi:hypothetical protein